MPSKNRPHSHLESTDVAPRSSYWSPMRRPASDTSTPPPLFLLFNFHRFTSTCLDSGQFRWKRESIWPKWPPIQPILAETATETGWYGRFRPKQLLKQAKMGSGCHSSASCGLVRGGWGRKKRRKKKTRRHQKKKKKG